MDYLLLVLIGLLGYWFSQLDARVTQQGDKIVLLAIDTRGEKIRQEEILKLLEKMDKRIENIEKVLYQRPPRG